MKSEKKAKKLSASPTFMYFKTFNENLKRIQRKKAPVNLVSHFMPASSSWNDPSFICTNFIIIIKCKYGEKAHLLFTDMEFYRIMLRLPTFMKIWPFIQNYLTHQVTSKIYPSSTKNMKNWLL